MPKINNQKQRNIFESASVAQENHHGLAALSTNVLTGDNAIDVMRDMDVRATFRELFGKKRLSFRYWLPSRLFTSKKF